MEKFPVIGLILSCFSVICTLISFIPKYWVYSEEVTGNYVDKIWLGLWLYCSSRSVVGTQDNAVCYYHYEDNFPADKVFLGVTQTLISQALIAQVVVLVFSFLKMSLMQDKRHLYPVIITLSIIAALMLFFGAVIFAAKVNEVDPTGTISYSSSLHFAFVFAILSAIVSIAAALFTYFETKRD